MATKKVKPKKLTPKEAMEIERFHDLRKIRDLEVKNAQEVYARLQQKKKMLEQEVELTGYSLDAAKKDLAQKETIKRGFTVDFKNFSKELRERLDLPEGSSFDYDSDTLEITLEE